MAYGKENGSEERRPSCGSKGWQDPSPGKRQTWDPAREQTAMAWLPELGVQLLLELNSVPCVHQMLKE